MDLEEIIKNNDEIYDDLQMDDHAVSRVANFISALLSSQLKEVLGIVESKRKQEPTLYDIYSYNSALDDLKAEIEKLNN